MVHPSPGLIRIAWNWLCDLFTLVSQQRRIAEHTAKLTARLDSLATQVTALAAAQAAKPAVTYSNGHYFDAQGVAICPTCWAGKGIAIPFQAKQNPQLALQWIRYCGSCNYEEKYLPPLLR